MIKSCKSIKSSILLDLVSSKSTLALSDANLSVQDYIQITNQSIHQKERLLSSLTTSCLPTQKREKLYLPSIKTGNEIVSMQHTPTRIGHVMTDLVSHFITTYKYSFYYNYSLTIIGSIACSGEAGRKRKSFFSSTVGGSALKKVDVSDLEKSCFVNVVVGGGDGDDQDDDEDVVEKDQHDEMDVVVLDQPAEYSSSINIADSSSANIVDSNCGSVVENAVESVGENEESVQVDGQVEESTSTTTATKPKMSKKRKPRVLNPEEKRHVLQNPI